MQVNAIYEIVETVERWFENNQVENQIFFKKAQNSDCILQSTCSKQHHKTQMKMGADWKVNTSSKGQRLGCKCSALYTGEHQRGFKEDAAG